jgi:hypothetical protein
MPERFEMLTKVQIIACCWLVALATTAAAAEPARPGASTSATTSATATREQGPPKAPTRIKRENLRAPDVTRLFTQKEIAAILARAVDPNLEDVEVEGARVRGRSNSNAPRAWGGIAAPVWAMLNPTQAWRIIAPLPDAADVPMDTASTAVAMPLTARSIPRIGEQ